MFYFYWNKFFPDIFAFFAPPRFFYSFRLTHSVSFAIGIWPNYSLFFPLISLHLHRATDSLRFFFFCSPMQFFPYTFVPFFSRAHSPFFGIPFHSLYVCFFSSSLSRVVCALDFYICPVDFGMCWFMCANAQFGIIITMMENKAAITKMSTNNDYTISLSSIAQAMATPADQKQQQ